MQTLGCDINPTSYSKLEGQTRSATDMEVFVIAKILSIPMEELFKNVCSNPKFLYSAFYSYTNDQVVDFFESYAIIGRTF